MIDFGKVVREITNEDGSVTIQTEGYYNGKPGSVIETVREDIKTNKNDLLKDVITCLDALKTNTPQVELVIKKDKFNNPMLIQKTTVVYKTKNN